MCAGWGSAGWGILFARCPGRSHARIGLSQPTDLWFASAVGRLALSRPAAA